MSPPKNPLAARFVVATDGVATTCMLPPKEWLLSQPAGAYTTSRTCSGATRLFEWDTHVERTASSAASMIGEADTLGGAAASALLDQVGTADALRPRLDATVRAAVRSFASEADPAASDELKLTVLVSWSPDDAGVGGGASGYAADGSATARVSCHVAPMPALPSAPVRVEVRGSARSNAEAKDSSWVSERTPLEALLAEDFNELLLLDDYGRCGDRPRKSGWEPPRRAPESRRTRPPPPPHDPRSPPSGCWKARRPTSTR